MSETTLTAAAVLRLDPRTYDRALQCVHCGLCLPACPTYTETGHEADSPRGRIQLMRGMADGTVQFTGSVRRHLDLCLDCRGCESACPSGVVYHELIEETRERLADTQTAGLQSRFMRWLYFNVFTQPSRLKVALLPARILQKLGLYRLIRRSGLLRALPSQLRKMEQMLPPQGSLWPAAVPERTSAVGTRSRTVGLFAGCVGSVMYQDVNRKAVALLAACGAEVLAPRGQICCGAIHHHNAAHEKAMEMARHNIDTFMPVGDDGVDLIVTAIAGCGAMLREYDLLLRDDPRYAERARQFAARVRDISEVLLEMGLAERLRHPVNLTITYHDACHLAHAQKVVDAPRTLLARVPGLMLAAMPDSDMCCGAAGTYNLTQPEMARRLAERKLDSIAATGAGTVAAGNVGCAMHIQSEADARGRTIRVVHPVDILHESLTGRA